MNKNDSYRIRLVGGTSPPTNFCQQKVLTLFQTCPNKPYSFTNWLLLTVGILLCLSTYKWQFVQDDLFQDPSWILKFVGNPISRSTHLLSSIHDTYTMVDFGGSSECMGGHAWPIHRRPSEVSGQPKISFSDFSQCVEEQGSNITGWFKLKLFGLKGHLQKALFKNVLPGSVASIFKGYSIY